MLSRPRTDAHRPDSSKPLSDRSRHCPGEAPASRLSQLAGASPQRAAVAHQVEPLLKRLTPVGITSPYVGLNPTVRREVRPPDSVEGQVPLCHLRQREGRPALTRHPSDSPSSPPACRCATCRTLPATPPTPSPSTSSAATEQPVRAPGGGRLVSVSDPATPMRSLRRVGPRSPSTAVLRAAHHRWRCRDTRVARRSHRAGL